MVIVDADVMIEVLRKNPAVASYLRNDIGVFNIVLSAITIAEIQQGASNKENLQQINRLLKQYIVLPIDHNIPISLVPLYRNMFSAITRTSEIPLLRRLHCTINCRF
jgi:predicted nucleic acid-binding protein